MKQYFHESGYNGYLNFDTDAEVMERLQKLAKIYFRDNPESTGYRVAVIDFDTREHSIIEIVVETKFDITEY